MGMTIVVGAQLGDEGKGKIVQLLAQNSKAVIRTHGGNNAGHTIWHNGKKLPLHLIPCGVSNEECQLMITAGVVVDPGVLCKEIDMVISAGIRLKGRLSVSPLVNLIMPYHKILDGIYEDLKGDAKTGTTRRGICPCHADKVSYNGIRLFDLAQPKVFREKLLLQLGIKRKIINALDTKPARISSSKITHEERVQLIKSIEEQERALDFNLVWSEVMAHYEEIYKAGYIRETHGMIVSLLNADQNVLFEGAHGLLLDNEYGTYPFVTASKVVPEGPMSYLRQNHKDFPQIIGVTKAYTTRVGAGPFPTKLSGEIGNLIRKNGVEFGTTTGRERDCGWLDGEALRYAIGVSGINRLAVTKLDVLDTFEEVKICTRYIAPGRRVFMEDVPTEFLSDEDLVPVYETMPGWGCSTREVRKFCNLPSPARDFIGKIEEVTRTPVSIVSVGPEAEETILR